jgi:hypothetical protein
VSANDRTGVGSGSGEWRTPPDLFARLNRRYAFDYDAFASHANRLAPHYSTAEGTFRLFDRNAHPDNDLDEGELRPHRVSLETGIEYDWTDRRVFMNPPYGREFIGKAIGKAMSERERAAIIVALLPASTDTLWFHQCIRPYAEIEFLRKRVRFIDPATGRPGGSPPSGSMIVVWRSELQP